MWENEWSSLHKNDEAVKSDFRDISPYKHFLSKERLVQETDGYV